MRRQLLGKTVYLPLDPYKTSRRIEIRMLKQYLDVQPGDRLCDIGSGTGYWTENISGPAYTVGIDILWRDTIIAAQHHQGKHAGFVAANAEKMPFADGAFNKMFGVCSVEHIPDNVAAFSEFSRCLQPGGVLALTLDALNYEAISPEVRDAHAKRYWVAHFYDKKNVPQLLGNAGFEVTHMQYLLCSPFAHWLNQWVDRNRKLQYPFFPFSYPLTILSDKFFGRDDQGWKLAVRAVKM
ncbi:MAG: methyltransferase domain-containing protein [Candidatus Hydrogenedentes bacterium]|nr:methyltransferase domain-containing protein [Candidatus Hydrogenedentota bacterium]